jgi:hypothetical protein
MTCQPINSIGLPVWSGRDRILNLNLARHWINYVSIGCAPALALLVAVTALYVWCTELAEDLLPYGSAHLGFMTFDWQDSGATILWLVLLALVGSVSWCVFVRVEAAIPLLPSAMFDRDWKLHAGEGGMTLTYRASEFSPYLAQAGVGGSHWSVSLNDIARVESGRTAEWIPHRAMAHGPLWASGRDGDGVLFGGGFVAVPPTEYQAFLFLNDGSRRVISTLHNGREETAKLAASVRAWVEAQRAAPLEILLVGSADERGEGFDI